MSRPSRRVALLPVDYSVLARALQLPSDMTIEVAFSPEQHSDVLMLRVAGPQCPLAFEGDHMQTIRHVIEEPPASPI